MNVPATKVAIEPVYESDMTPSGLLYVPDIAKTRVVQGIVKYIGSKVTELEIGDYVLFGGYSGSLIFLQDEGRTIIIDEKFVIAKIDPPDNVRNTDVPGLFFRDKFGDYFAATYEMAMILIADMVKETPFRKTFKSNLAEIGKRESKRDGYDFGKDI